MMMTMISVLTLTISRCSVSGKDVEENDDDASGHREESASEFSLTL